MEIVVLDGYTVNPGDLSWKGFQEIGNLYLYDRTTVKAVVERCARADIILTNKTPLTRPMLNRLPNLKYIGILATGYNIVDNLAATQRGITVSNVPDYATNSVAQMTFALLLELCHHVQRHSDSVKHGQWSRADDFCYWNYPLVELAGKTMGIIGFGTIGQRVADVALVLGMNLLAVSKSKKNQTHRNNFRWVEMDELLRKSDVISIHCPLLPETKGLINRENLYKMKKSSFLINTSRGQIIVEKDLAHALNSGKIAGAALDVLSIEPPSPGNPLFNAKNCIITPHISWATAEARKKLMDIALKNLLQFLSGHPTNVVNQKI